MIGELKRLTLRTTSAPESSERNRVMPGATE